MAEVNFPPSRRDDHIKGAIESERAPAIRVLAVDDEPAASKLIAIMLPSPAFYCTTAGNGEEALAVLQRERFDAVISDLQMPGISGLELLAQVRHSYPHVAFLVTTGVDDVDVGVQAMRCGADDYLVKPLRESAVRASLGSALHKQHLEQQLENYRERLEEMVAERTGQLREALGKIKRSYEDTLQALGAAIDLRDNETAGHSKRVCLYAIEIARAMGWSEKQLDSLASGANLHDIGKLGIPDGILLKPGPLSADERKLMQRHAQLGFDLVKDIDFLADAAEIVLAHHERFDGTGYPRAQKNFISPESARILLRIGRIAAPPRSSPDMRRSGSVRAASSTQKWYVLS
jgi:putative nucleotidyltransferase with HDIG domain